MIASILVARLAMVVKITLMAMAMEEG